MPKNFGSHSTRSASLPGSTEPISWSDGWSDRSYAIPTGGLFGTGTTDFFCTAVERGSSALIRLLRNPIPTLVFFGALLGRKAVSASTLGRATTAARSVSRIGRASQDVARAEAELQAVQTKQQELSHALEEEMHEIADRWDTSGDTLDRVVLKPKRNAIVVQLVALLWLPR